MLLLYIILLAVLFFVIKLYIKLSKEEKKEEAEIQKRLDDALIYDPETKTKITLEEAEKGEWAVTKL